MSNSTNSEHRAMGWAAIGGALMGVGALAGISLGLWGAGAHLWSDDYFLAGFSVAALLALLGIYVLWAEFIGGVGPVKFPLPLTRREREAQRRASRAKPMRVVAPPQRRVPIGTAPKSPSQGAGMTQARREAAVKQYKQTLQREAEQREQIKRELQDAEPKAVSNEHRDMLKGVAGCLLRYLNASQTAFYGSKGDELKAQSFAEHFPEIHSQVENWNARIDVRERTRDQLRSWVASRLHALHYDQMPFCGGLDLPITEEALKDVPRLVFTEVLGALHLGPYPVVVLPSMAKLDPNWGSIPEVDRAGVERELQEIAVEGAGRAERQLARDAARALPEVGDRLSSELELIQAKDVIRGLGDCELCR